MGRTQGAGRFNDAILIRIEKELREELGRLSLEEDRPVSSMARLLIREALAARKKIKNNPLPKTPRGRS